MLSQKKEEQMKTIVSSFLVAAMLLLISNPAFASNVKIENVKIGQSNPVAWCVSGMVRNLENHPIKGYVKIKFLNSRGDIARSYSAFVNDNDPIAPGQAASFEYFGSPEEFEGVVDFQVIFKDM